MPVLHPELRSFFPEDSFSQTADFPPQPIFFRLTAAAQKNKLFLSLNSLPGELKCRRTNP
jgi:hypothetical protein